MTIHLVPPAPGPIDEERFLEALLDGDGPTALAVTRACLERGAGLGELLDRVFAPALHEVGLRWQNATISVAHEHLATATAQATLARLFSERNSPTGNGRTAVVCCTEGELHSLGGRFVADVLEDEGWDVTDLGASTPSAALVGFVADRRPDVVALSTVRSANLPAAKHVLGPLRELVERPLLVVGGSAYSGSAELALSWGADLFIERMRDIGPALAAALAER